MMIDQYFEKRPEPPQPLVSTASVVVLCLTVAFCVFFGFACVQPEAALEILGGLAFFLTAVFFMALIGNVLR
jgi:F0F1-type ATP synthase assembly protein I